MRQSLRFNSL